METNKFPLMYKGYIIKRCSNGKLSAYSYNTDYFINPLYDTFDKLKIIIDALK
jgi:hypothetical protein